MAQRQFRNDDTSKWLEKYGKGKAGNVAPAGTTTDDQGNAACTGTVDTDQLSYSSLVGDALQNGDILYIVQAHGTGAMTEPNHELNVIKSFNGSVITTKYPLTRTYNSGAQVYILRQHKTWSMDGGAWINIRQFNGTTGGFFIRLANKKIYVNAATINGIGFGFNGGLPESLVGNVQAQAGASPSSNSNPQQTSANEGGGGGARDNGGGQGASGGGGGNKNAGQSGGATGGTVAGAGGNQLSKTQLKVISMGPGGGGGEGPGGNDNGGFGGDGGATVIFIAPEIEVTDLATIYLNGEAGNTDGSPGGSQGSGGGGGASGDFLAKGERVKLGNGRIQNLGGVGGWSNSGNPVGGTGSIGYGHVDYSRSVEGTLADNSGLTTRQDKSLNRRPSPAGLFIFLEKFMSR